MDITTEDHIIRDDECSDIYEGDVSIKPSKLPKTNIWDISDDNELYNQVIFSIMYSNTQLGLAFYIVESAELYIMCDVAETRDYELLKRVLLQVDPTVILTSSIQDESLQQILTNYAEPNSSTDSNILSTKSTVEVLPSTEFSKAHFSLTDWGCHNDVIVFKEYESCHRRILSFPSIPGIPAGASEEERAVKISSLIPLDSQNMVRSLGALLKYLEKKRVGIELDDAGTRVPILTIKKFTLDKLVLMNNTAYSSLRIFYRESHPSVYKDSRGSKEGLSLFGIANHTRSPLGQKLLKLWFLRPLKDLSMLQSRQKAIEFLSNPRHSDITSSFIDCLKNIKNIPRILVHLMSSQLTISEWQALYKTAYNAICIGDICQSLPQTIDIFKKISSIFNDDLHRIASLINKIIDFEESNIQNRFVVKHGVDSGLDEKKQTYNGLPDLMTRVASTELEKLDSEVIECQVIYVPQLGYLLRFQRTSWMKEEKDFHVDDMMFVFLSEDYVHYKTSATKELDRLLGDTQCEIHDCETAIMHRLQSVISEHTQTLVSIVECTAELDCLVSLTLLARDHNYVKPELTDDNVIYIKAGRHPLQELCVNTFVPNDTCLDLTHGRMKILTGANASGKSVYLTQVGLIVYLAHIGSFVPAEIAKIGLQDSIFTRIQTKESVSVSQSAFLIDINQVSCAVQSSTERSLILLDEFGKGTATVDGLSLLTAVLRYWLRKEKSCPNILVSTHFHSVIQQKLLPTTKLVEYLTMDTVNENGELIFLYQLTQGHSDTSYACHIAANVGLPQSIIKRGALVSDQIRQNETVTRADQVDMETRNKTCASIVSRFLDLDLERDNVVGFLQEFVLPSAKDVL